MIFLKKTSELKPFMLRLAYSHSIFTETKKRKNLVSWKKEDHNDNETLIDIFSLVLL